MTLFQAIILGVLQGLTEFLPISSSGHLIVVPWLLHWPPQGLAFDVALHMGTLIAVLYAFLDDWVRIVGSALRGLRRGRPFAEPDGRLLGLLVVASIPAGVAGLLLNHWAETTFRSPLLVATTMAVMGLVLFFADRRAGGGETRAITLRDAILVGSAQALALVPGVSRSGATISMGLLLGLKREEAARFSFLLATPITFGAGMLEIRKIGGGDPRLLTAGIVAAAVVGVLAIRGLLAYVRTRDYRPFVVYRLAFAVLVAAAFFLRGGFGS